MKPKLIFIVVGGMKDFFKHVENLDESDNDDYVNFSEEEDEIFLKKKTKNFLIR
jgi:hypothetical protein